MLPSTTVSQRWACSTTSYQSPSCKETPTSQDPTHIPNSSSTASKTTFHCFELLFLQLWFCTTGPHPQAMLHHLLKALSILLSHCDQKSLSWYIKHQQSRQLRGLFFVHLSSRTQGLLNDIKGNTVISVLQRAQKQA